MKHAAWGSGFCLEVSLSKDKRLQVLPDSVLHFLKTTVHLHGVYVDPSCGSFGFTQATGGVLDSCGSGFGV